MKLPYAFVGMLLVAYKYKLTNNKNEYVVKTSLDLFSMSDEDNYQKINEKLTHNLTVAKLQESLIFMTFNIENVKGTFRYYLEQQLPAKVAKQLISKKNYEYKIYKNKVVIRRYITLTSFNDMKIQIEELRKECNRFYFMYA